MEERLRGRGRHDPAPRRRDPDGDPWEVAHNLNWMIGGDGSVTLAK